MLIECWCNGSISTLASRTFIIHQSFIAAPFLPFIKLRHSAIAIAFRSQGENRFSLFCHESKTELTMHKCIIKLDIKCVYFVMHVNRWRASTMSKLLLFGFAVAVAGLVCHFQRTRAPTVIVAKPIDLTMCRIMIDRLSVCNNGNCSFSYCSLCLLGACECVGSIAKQLICFQKIGKFPVALKFSLNLIHCPISAHLLFVQFFVYTHLALIICSFASVSPSLSLSLYQKW